MGNEQQNQAGITGTDQSDSDQSNPTDPTQYLTLAEASRAAPNRPSTNCVWRWCRQGVKARSKERIRLQHVRIGGKLFTTSQWMSEFFERLTKADTDHFDQRTEAAEGAHVQKSPRTKSQQRRQAELEQVERELDAAGL